ncbi:hypothetical protein PISMIDRAFT_272275 [Pisolithus microcarpus 441]|uniref:Uncharacterized protein n=1 Tax=Pisolithus microcarpus 441 TaxID=765257 RepID=A0A0C9ZAK3_9AGAM|nr:hypothetical protein PISMIDRAFT_272275 [Pisolithus microcarpus 441]
MSRSVKFHSTHLAFMINNPDKGVPSIGCRSTRGGIPCDGGTLGPWTYVSTFNSTIAGNHPTTTSATLLIWHAAAVKFQTDKKCTLEMDCSPSYSRHVWHRYACN